MHLLTKEGVAHVVHVLTTGNGGDHRTATEKKAVVWIHFLVFPLVRMLAQLSFRWPLINPMMEWHRSKSNFCPFVESCSSHWVHFISGQLSCHITLAKRRRAHENFFLTSLNCALPQLESALTLVLFAHNLNWFCHLHGLRLMPSNCLVSWVFSPAPHVAPCECQPLTSERRGGAHFKRFTIFYFTQLAVFADLLQEQCFC